MKKIAPIHNNVAINKRYEKALQQIVDQMRKSTKKELNVLFSRKYAKTYFKLANDAKKNQSLSTKAKLAIAALLLKFQLMFRRKSKTLVQAMLEDVEKYASTAVRRSLKELTGEIFKTSVISDIGKTKSQAIITENISLMKSIPEQYFTQITSKVMRAIVTGSTASLAEAIEKHGKVSEKRAKVIAIDQVHKAIQATVMQKLLDQGFSKFRWVYTYRSKEPRMYHIHRNGKIFSFKNPPGGELPGQPINCKCLIGVVADWEK